MKKLFVFSLSMILLGGCASVKKSTDQRLVLISEKQLKSDIDFVHKKLQKLHPELYWYISKEKLDFKFDSLKSAITAPMTAGLRLMPSHFIRSALNASARSGSFSQK